MVSKASDDFPDPDRPVSTTSESRGSVIEMFFRLCSRAPETTIALDGGIHMNCREANRRSPFHVPAICVDNAPRDRAASAAVTDLADDPEAHALLPVVEAALGAALSALDALDVSAIPAEPDLDPSRAPRPPITRPAHRCAIRRHRRA